MAIDFKALGAKAAAAGADQTKAVAGGGTDFVPPAEGPGVCRFVGYVELGKQKGTFKGAPTIKEKVLLVFELVGKRHPPNELPDGTKVPQRVTIEENFSLNEKAHFFKIFQRMNYKQDAQHITQLLGEGFKCEVHHRKWVGKQDGKERIEATLKGPGGYTVAPPRVEAREDEESDGGWVYVTVPQATTPIKGFIWDHADMEQWDGLFIDGEYPERKDDKGNVTAPAKSKNVLQNRIKNAVNFIGSPIHALLVAGGKPIDIPTIDQQDEEDEGGPGNDLPQSGASATTGTTTSPSEAKAAATNDALGGIV